MVECKYYFTPAEQKVSTIQVTKYDEKNFIGVLENTYYPEEKHFTNLTQLILLIEGLQDEIAYPQRGMEPRRFKDESPPPLCFGSSGKAKSPIATFQLRILFRQNASWQGIVTWVEQQQEANFRSVLELIHLMDSVLSS